MLTQKQLELLEFIHKRIAREGVPPSFDEMKQALDLRSKSGIHRLVTALEERGFLRRLPHRARAIEVVRLPDALSPSGSSLRAAATGSSAPAQKAARRASANAETAVELEILGRIAADIPIKAIRDGPHTCTVPTTMLSGPGRHYALEVRGDSMIGVGIINGDVVVIRETSVVDNGDIVVAQVEGCGATLKRFRRKGGTIALEAANPAYETRILPVGSVKVQGRLTGLIRIY